MFLEKYLDLLALILSVLERMKGAFMSMSVHKIVCPLTGCENKSLRVSVCYTYNKLSLYALCGSAAKCCVSK
jgi:hypothetical protein